ncbi:MAG: response regulator [Candidatus Staskawiczbacteria bacterium]|nr:response regulator [Candidatus Staskawiczbacteria bacterium]
MAEEIIPPVKQSAPASNAGAGKKILIVEDDKDILFIFKTKFTGEGFSVVIAQDGEEGANVAEKEKPDLILADILLPKMDGLAMAEKIKKSNNTAKIIFLTNMKDTEYINNIKKSGEFDYLIKSDLRIEDIVDKVKIKLGLK